MCYPGIHDCTRDDGTNRETPEGPGSRQTNQIRIIVGVKRADKRNMDELRVEVGVNKMKKKLVRSCWAGHLGTNGR